LGGNKAFKNEVLPVYETGWRYRHGPYLAEADWQEIVKQTSGRPALLDGERKGFAEHGGMMNLLVYGDTVRCKVNLRRTQRTVPKLSERLVNIVQLFRDSETAP
jgi:hypothetical protein